MQRKKFTVYVSIKKGDVFHPEGILLEQNSSASQILQQVFSVSANLLNILIFFSSSFSYVCCHKFLGMDISCVCRISQMILIWGLQQSSHFLSEVLKHFVPLSTLKHTPQESSGPACFLDTNNYINVVHVNDRHLVQRKKMLTRG